MRLLFDTHALIWWLSDDPRLGHALDGLIEDPANQVLVSAVSLWEILIKVRAGTLTLDIQTVMYEIGLQGFSLLDVTPGHLLALAALPMHHKDPFDHLLIAQAIAEGAIFVSDDGYTGRYPVRHVTCSGAWP